MVTHDDVAALIREFLSLGAQVELSPDSPLEAVPGWDSLSWINILNAIQDRHHKDLPLDAVARVRTLGDLVDLVNAT